MSHKLLLLQIQARSLERNVRGVAADAELFRDLGKGLSGHMHFVDSHLPWAAGSRLIPLADDRTHGVRVYA